MSVGELLPTCRYCFHRAYLETNTETPSLRAGAYYSSSGTLATAGVNLKNFHQANYCIGLPRVGLKG